MAKKYTFAFKTSLPGSCSVRSPFIGACVSVQVTIDLDCADDPDATAALLDRKEVRNRLKWAESDCYWHGFRLADGIAEVLNELCTSREPT